MYKQYKPAAECRETILYSFLWSELFLIQPQYLDDFPNSSSHPSPLPAWDVGSCPGRHESIWNTTYLPGCVLKSFFKSFSCMWSESDIVTLAFWAGVPHLLPYVSLCVFGKTWHRLMCYNWLVGWQKSCSPRDPFVRTSTRLCFYCDINKDTHINKSLAIYFLFLLRLSLTSSVWI